MNKTLKFFILTYVVSWFMWLPSVINTQFKEMPGILLLIGMFAGFLPSVVGLMMLKNEKGQTFKSYMKDKLSLSFSKKWLLVMLLFPLQAGLSLMITQYIQPGFEVVNPIPALMFPLVFVQILLIGGALGEEFGWRGYVYEKLLKKQGMIKATLLLGVLWSFWHLPLFYMANTVQSHLPLWQFVLQNTLLSFFYTWIYHRTKGNLILMILLHAVMNTSAAMLPYWHSNLGRFIGLAMMIIMLIGIKIIDKKSFKVL